MLCPSAGLSPSCTSSDPASVNLDCHQKMAQELGPCSPDGTAGWSAWLSPGLDMAIVAIWEVNQQWKIFVSLLFCLLKKINLEKTTHNNFLPLGSVGIPCLCLLHSCSLPFMFLVPFLWYFSCLACILDLVYELTFHTRKFPVSHSAF